MIMILIFSCFFVCYGDHRELNVLTLSFPTRRASDLCSSAASSSSAAARLTCGGEGRSASCAPVGGGDNRMAGDSPIGCVGVFGGCFFMAEEDRKSTRLNSSH